MSFNLQPEDLWYLDIEIHDLSVKIDNNHADFDSYFSSRQNYSNFEYSVSYSAGEYSNWYS